MNNRVTGKIVRENYSGYLFSFSQAFNRMLHIRLEAIFLISVLGDIPIRSLLPIILTHPTQQPTGTP